VKADYDIYCRDSGEHDELPGLDTTRDVEPVPDDARPQEPEIELATWSCGRLRAALAVQLATELRVYPAGTVIFWDEYGLVYLRRRAS
jgi:hypothetical protein